MWPKLWWVGAELICDIAYFKEYALNFLAHSKINHSRIKKIESPHKTTGTNYSVLPQLIQKPKLRAHYVRRLSSDVIISPVYYHDMFMDERRWQNCNFPCTYINLSLRQYQAFEPWSLKRSCTTYIFRIKFFLRSVVAGLMLFTWIMKISIGHVCPRNKELTPRGASCTTSRHRF